MSKRIIPVLFRYLRKSSLYSVLMRKWLCSRIGYRVATVEDASALARHYDYGEFPDLDSPAERFAKQFESLEGLGSILIAEVGEKIVGSLTIRRFPESVVLYRDWWIFDMLVRKSYQRLAIGTRLTQIALDKAVQAGASRVNLLVNEQNKAAIELYRKAGLQQTSIPGLDANLEEEAQKGARRRIIMSLSLAEN